MVTEVKENELTLDQLKEMKPGIFQTGEGELPYDGMSKWVATRGHVHDWAIYCGPPNASDDFIKTRGDKLHDEKKVRELVSCTDEAFEMYRH